MLLASRVPRSKGDRLTAESTRARVTRPDGPVHPHASAPPFDELAWRCINAIRALSMDAVEQAQSGHPGTPMALAPAAYVLRAPGARVCRLDG